LVKITPRLTSTVDHIKNSIANSRLAQNRLVILAWRVFQGMGQDDAGHLAAGVAYYAIFSLFPLLLGVLAIMGPVLDSEELQQRFCSLSPKACPGPPTLWPAMCVRLCVIEGPWVLWRLLVCCGQDERCLPPPAAPSTGPGVSTKTVLFTLLYPGK
jgi:hypothetical protein